MVYSICNDQINSQVNEHSLPIEKDQSISSHAYLKKFPEHGGRLLWLRPRMYLYADHLDVVEQARGVVEDVPEHLHLVPLDVYLNKCHARRVQREQG